MQITVKDSSLRLTLLFSLLFLVNFLESFDKDHNFLKKFDKGHNFLKKKITDKMAAMPYVLK